MVEGDHSYGDVRATRSARMDSLSQHVCELEMPAQHCLTHGQSPGPGSRGLAVVSRSQDAGLLPQHPFLCWFGVRDPQVSLELEVETVRGI